MALAIGGGGAWRLEVGDETSRTLSSARLTGVIATDGAACPGFSLGGVTLRSASFFFARTPPVSFRGEPGEEARS